MSLFRRDLEPASGARPPASRPAEGSGAQTRIAPGTLVTGEVRGSADLAVDGQVEGRVELEAGLIVGPDGVVQGRVEARWVRIAGKVVGDVHGRERVELLASGTVQGDVFAPRVTIADGAFLKGRVEMTAETPPAAPAAGVAKADPGAATRPRPAPGEPRRAAPAAAAPAAGGAEEKA